MPFAILAAIAIGLCLGMLGSGGSILTVPVLTYVIGQPEKLAIASSLAIVGGVSIVGAVPYALRRDVDWRSVAWFGVPGMAGAWLGAGVAHWVPGMVQLLAFAVTMLTAALRMFRGGASRQQAAISEAMETSPQSLRLIGAGLLVGVVTGLIGVGGGFLIVPALVMLLGLTMRRAVGTSLFVIATNAFTGFAKSLGTLKALQLALNWHVIAMFVIVGGVGTLAGNAIGARLPQQRLRQGFAALLVCMSAYMIVHEGHTLFTTVGTA